MPEDRKMVAGMDLIEWNILLVLVRADITQKYIAQGQVPAYLVRIDNKIVDMLKNEFGMNPETIDPGFAIKAAD